MNDNPTPSSTSRDSWFPYMHTPTYGPISPPNFLVDKLPQAPPQLVDAQEAHSSAYISYAAPATPHPSTPFFPSYPNNIALPSAYHHSPLSSPLPLVSQTAVAISTSLPETGLPRRAVSGSLDPTTGIFYRTPEPPRLRTAQACEKCRKRKAKCSGEHPACQRCILRGLVCIYAPEGRLRGPAKQKLKPLTTIPPTGSRSATSSTDVPSSSNASSSSSASSATSTASSRWAVVSATDSGAESKSLGGHAKGATVSSSQTESSPEWDFQSVLMEPSSHSVESLPLRGAEGRRGPGRPRKSQRLANLTGTTVSTARLDTASESVPDETGVPPQAQGVDNDCTQIPMEVEAEQTTQKSRKREASLTLSFSQGNSSQVTAIRSLQGEQPAGLDHGGVTEPSSINLFHSFSDFPGLEGLRLQSAQHSPSAISQQHLRYGTGPFLEANSASTPCRVPDQDGAAVLQRSLGIDASVQLSQEGLSPSSLVLGGKSNRNGDISETHNVSTTLPLGPSTTSPAVTDARLIESPRASSARASPGLVPSDSGQANHILLGSPPLAYHELFPHDPGGFDFEYELGPFGSSSKVFQRGLPERVKDTMGTMDNIHLDKALDDYLDWSRIKEAGERHDSDDIDIEFDRRAQAGGPSKYLSACGKHAVCQRTKAFRANLLTPPLSLPHPCQRFVSFWGALAQNGGSSTLLKIVIKRQSTPGGIFINIRCDITFPPPFHPKDQPTVHKAVMVLERTTYTANGKKIVQIYPNGPYAPPLPPTIYDIPEKPIIREDNPDLGQPNSSNEAGPSGTMENIDPNAHSLKQYLRQIWMPAYKVGARSGTNTSWCYHPELRAPHGTRMLICIRRITNANMHDAFNRWENSVADIGIPVHPRFNEITADLALPSAGIADLGDDDLFILDHHEINYVTDLSRMLKMFTLRTVEKAYRLFYGTSEPSAPAADFRVLYSTFPLQGARFDLLGLPGLKPNELSMVLVVVPHWDLDYSDLRDFVQEGNQTPGSLDMIPAARPPYYSTVLWAVLWEVCSKANCRFFAVTTYGHWTFGNFSDGLRTAQLTDQICAPIFPKEASVSLQDIELCHQPNVLEYLLFWMAASRDSGRNLVKLPPDPVITHIEAFVPNQKSDL
ncbi:hypothetical protein ID866_2868 [Astraeus odoratus]|nr:hypothetical protein ID866_2868 [Astraeus odoratus]